jgi:hypothetical protein
MQQHFGRWAGLALSAALLAASSSEAQPRGREPSAADVAASLRAKGHASNARAVLTQARGSRSRQVMDEIADTLVAFAIGFPGSDRRNATIRNAALLELTDAGVGESGVPGVDTAIPYAGAAERIMRIAETAQDVGIRGGALWAVTQLPNNGAVIPFLTRVASSQNIVAYSAIDLLDQVMKAEGRSVLRDLYQRNAVTEPTAREALWRLAGAYGWR